MTTRILVIRHGESIANLEKFFAGQSNIGLTDLGIKQAETAAEAMKDVHIDKIFSSTLDRAYYTALPFAMMRNLEVIRIYDFIEMNCGHWTGKTFAEVEKLYHEERMLWKKDAFHLKITDGESYIDVSLRIEKAIRTLAKENKGKTILVASHGGAIRTIPYSFSKEKSAKIFNATPIPTNCSITEIVFSENGGEVVRYSDDSYLKNLKSGAFII